MVEYPGFVRNDRRALRTMGGEEAIAEERSRGRRFLEVRFGGEGGTAHGAYGDASDTDGLGEECGGGTEREGAKKQGSPGAGSGGREEGEEGEEEGEEGEIGVGVVARIEETYRFESLTDFQWVPSLHASHTPPRQHSSPFHSHLHSSPAATGAFLRVCDVM
ncbi:hypothetical protein CLOM_g2352 [Closterium sp. NIES-68]|nr:hypothetical protein CLOM_g2352 [Closterium sp. NIES-68]